MRKIILGAIMLTNLVMLCAQKYSLSGIPFAHNGVELEYPFAGGMNSPQFSQIDLNQDGLSDIFVFDRVGSRVTTYIRMEANTMNFSYAPQYESLFPQIDSWAFVRDYNQDGIPDLIVSDNIPTVFGVQVYTGKMVDEVLSFDLFQFTNGDFNVIFFTNEQGSLEQLEVLSSDLPVVADVDFDGDIDILRFGNSGIYLEYIQNQSVELGFGSDSLRFKRVDECWGKFFESGNLTASIDLSDDPNTCFTNGIIGGTVSSRHVGSTSTAIDADNDQLMDLLIGDISSESIIFLKNSGTQDSAWVTDLDDNFPSANVPVRLKTFVAAFALDANDDGLQDLIFCPNQNLNTENVEVAHLYLDQGTENSSDYQLESLGFIVENMIDLSQGSRPAVVDYNADGLIDIVVGTFGRLDEIGFAAGRLYLYENTGTADNPSFDLVDDDWLELTQFGSQYIYLTPTFGDIDGDLDLDLLIGVQSGRLIFYQNIAGVGSPLSFATPIFDYMAIDVGGHCNPSIVDIDGDGLMDLVIGEENGNRNADQSDICSHLSFYRNIGESLSPSFNPDINADINISCFGDVRTDDPLLSRRGYASPQFLTLDGEMVLLVGGRQGKALMYTNINDKGEPFKLIHSALGGIDVGERSHPLLWDFNNDNLLELIVGNLTGGLIIYDSDLTLDQIVPTRDISESLSIDIYPNPVTDQLYVSSSETIVHMTIISMDGRIIRNYKHVKESVLAISDLEQGVYMLKIRTGSAQITRRFIKG